MQMFESFLRALIGIAGACKQQKKEKRKTKSAMHKISNITNQEQS